LIEQGEIYARFELQHLLLEGQAFDTATGSPPRGIQMDLTTGKTVLDTIVMANLGYFQFKAAPGYWNMKLREGLSSDIYKIDSTTQTDGSSEV
jgi:UDP-glucose:glycoprotein glucosyltransferase